MPAVAYVRMLTDHQKYSAENQLEPGAVSWKRKRFTNQVEGDSRHAEVICHAASFVERSL